MVPGSDYPKSQQDKQDNTRGSILADSSQTTSSHDQDWGVQKVVALGAQPYNQDNMTNSITTISFPRMYDNDPGWGSPGGIILKANQNHQYDEDNSILTLLQQETNNYDRGWGVPGPVIFEVKAREPDISFAHYSAHAANAPEFWSLVINTLSINVIICRALRNETEPQLILLHTCYREMEPKTTTTFTVSDRTVQRYKRVRTNINQYHICPMRGLQMGKHMYEYRRRHAWEHLVICICQCGTMRAKENLIKLHHKKDHTEQQNKLYKVDSDSWEAARKLINNLPAVMPSLPYQRPLDTSQPSTPVAPPPMTQPNILEGDDNISDLSDSDEDIHEIKSIIVKTKPTKREMVAQRLAAHDLRRKIHAIPPMVEPPNRISRVGRTKPATISRGIQTTERKPKYHPIKAEPI